MPVTLQPGPDTARAAENTQRLPPLERTTSVLLVEDEPLTAEVFARALLRAGHRVDVASDGLQALRRLRDRVPTLVVLDMSLPALSGTELVRRLRGMGHRKLPIVVVSGSPRCDADLTAAELWPGTWLEKPVKPRDLVAIVQDFTRDPG
ncbi:MAG: response regulator [Planctomycetes bacterium]|nr:response regulator [Planctomycetota bacterium]